jgi:hypothetical protein
LQHFANAAAAVALFGGIVVVHSPPDSLKPKWLREVEAAERASPPSRHVLDELVFYILLGLPALTLIGGVALSVETIFF